MKNIITSIKKIVSNLKKPKRSPKWRSVRKVHLLSENWCRNCGATSDLEVHHIKPFHIDPSSELEPSNLITLCEYVFKDCHLKKGHLGNWKKVNEKVREECVFKKLT